MSSITKVVNTIKLTALVHAVQTILEIADIWDLEKADVALIVAGRYLNKQQINKKEACAKLTSWMNKSITDPLHIK